MGEDVSRGFYFVDKAGQDPLFEYSNCRNATTQEKTESFPLIEEQESGDVYVTYALSKDYHTLLFVIISLKVVD